MRTPLSSRSSAGAIYLDRRRRIEELREAARRAAAQAPSIRRVVLFGSLTRGNATPRSDADILIVLEASEQPEARDRIPAMLAAMSPLPCSVDLCVVTAQELERAQEGGDPLMREALANGVDLLSG